MRAPRRVEVNFTPREAARRERETLAKL